MSHRKSLPLLLLAFAFLLALAPEGRGCSCGRKQTVLDEFEWADVVVVARVVSQERRPGPEPTDDAQAERDDWRRVSSTRMLVEKVYKGRLKVGEEMVFAQGGGADCIYTFDKEDIGRAYLFYLKRFKDADFWIAGTCGRSRSVEAARDDLLYLNNLDKARGRTRVSGTLGSYTGDEPDVAGLRIQIKGGGKTFETKTDEQGVYEIYDLPPGKYTLEPEIPPGWKVGNFWLGYSASFTGNDEERAPKQIPFVLEARRHAGLDIVFEIDNAVGGRVFDTQGRPLDGVCLQLLPARGEIPEHYYKGDCTERGRGGQFRMDELEPGDYVLVINREGKVTSRAPFGTVYYPNARTREEATVFHVGLGDHFENLEFRLTQMEETVTVEGLFLYSDGKPVADVYVKFKLDKNEDEDANALTKTDAKGRFALKILKGQKGILYGEMYTFVGEFENCPRLDNLIKKSGQTNADFKTSVVEIQADNNLYGVELRLPFPGCKKAKIE